jgi:hypothetical protein
MLRLRLLFLLLGVRGGGLLAAWITATPHLCPSL